MNEEFPIGALVCLGESTRDYFIVAMKERGADGVWDYGMLRVKMNEEPGTVVKMMDGSQFKRGPRRPTYAPVGRAGQLRFSRLSSNALKAMRRIA
jgi:hypothetical protein